MIMIMTMITIAISLCIIGTMTFPSILFRRAKILSQIASYPPIINSLGFCSCFADGCSSLLVVCACL